MVPATLLGLINVNYLLHSLRWQYNYVSTASLLPPTRFFSGEAHVSSYQSSSRIDLGRLAYSIPLTTVIGSRMGTWSDLNTWNSGDVFWGILGKSFISLLREQTLPADGGCEDMCEGVKSGMCWSHCYYLEGNWPGIKLTTEEGQARKSF